MRALEQCADDELRRFEQSSSTSSLRHYSCHLSSSSSSTPYH